MITQADYERCLEGFRIIDCAVRNRDIFYFTAVEVYESDDEMDEGPFESELRHRVIVYFSQKAPEERWNRQGYQGMKGLYAAATKYPDERFIGIDRDGDILVLGGGVNAMEEPIPPGPPVHHPRRLPAKRPRSQFDDGRRVGDPLW